MTLTGSILLNRGPPPHQKRTTPSDSTSKTGPGTIWTLSVISVSTVTRYKTCADGVRGAPADRRRPIWRSDRPCRWQPLACFALPQAASTVDSAASTELHMAIGVCDDEIFDAVALLDHLAWHGWRRPESLRGATPHASRMIWRPSACLWNDRSL